MTIPAEALQKPLTVEEKIDKAFPDDPRMLLVAYCESGNGCAAPVSPTAKNPSSTAKGVFQILDGTWAAAGCAATPSTRTTT